MRGFRLACWRVFGWGLLGFGLPGKVGLTLLLCPLPCPLQSLQALGAEGYAADCGLFIFPEAWHAQGWVKAEPVRVPVDGCSIIRRQAKELVCRAPEKEPKATYTWGGCTLHRPWLLEILADLIPIQLHVLELALVRLRGLCRVLCGLCLLSVGWGLLSGSEFRIQKGRRRCLAFC